MMRVSAIDTFCCCEPSANGAPVQHAKVEKTKDLWARWNSDNYQHMRELMLSGGTELVCNPRPGEPWECRALIPAVMIPQGCSSAQIANAKHANASFRAGEKVVTHYPWHLQLILDKACNLKCPICFQNPLRRNKVPYKLDVEVMRDQIVEFARHGWMLEIIGGEPTILPSYDTVIECVKEAQGSKICMVTNGHFIEDKVVPHLEWFRLISVSCDAATADTYSVCRPAHNPKQDFANLERNLRTLMAVNPYDRGVEVHANFTISGLNLGEVPDMIAWAHSFGIRHCYITEIMEADYSEFSDEVDPLLITSFRDYPEIIEAKLNEAIEMSRRLGVHLGYSFRTIARSGHSR